MFEMFKIIFFFHLSTVSSIGNINSIETQAQPYKKHIPEKLFFKIICNFAYYIFIFMTRKL